MHFEPSVAWFFLVKTNHGLPCLTGYIYNSSSLTAKAQGQMGSSAASTRDSKPMKQRELGDEENNAKGRQWRQKKEQQQQQKQLTKPVKR
jgi:hypothetical protein